MHLPPRDTETLTIDLPAIAEPDDLTPLQAIIWGDIIAALIAMACTFAGGAVAPVAAHLNGARSRALHQREISS